ncbi:TPA: hypothetical protein N0F65_006965 [Lagenidium giganteum]|uniref:Uncharacterized protein n=1 Tax=Lagenidium giganteum TaxID=4803 RepID=A0AAV2ZBZ7_9STRA|nr:TPA: hypothetical protein N0F65_006965 [Lagenidium giganteum]
MPVSKKRIQNRSTSSLVQQKVPAALKEWVHTWHGVTVQASDSVIFHTDSRKEEMSFFQQFIRLPSNSLFAAVKTYSNPRKRYKDFLYVLLNMRWAMLMTVLLLVFVVNIFFFAFAIYYMCGEPSSLLRAFNLSYQTFSTIGFGIVFPERMCGNLVMVVESFASMLVTSAITGLVFAKFAKPKAKVAFSKVCVIQPYGKKYLALVVRVANATPSRDVTHDVIMEANFKLNLVRVEQKSYSTMWHEVHGLHHSIAMSPANERDHFLNTKKLSSYNLKLLQNNFITFRMGIAVVHVIDEESPFYGMTENDILSSDMILEVSMSGVDSTLQDTVAERYTYTASHFRWGYRFAELLDFDERKSEVVMDFNKLSVVEPAAIDASLYVRPVRPPPSVALSLAPTVSTSVTNSTSSKSPHRTSSLQEGPGTPTIAPNVALERAMMESIRELASDAPAHRPRQFSSSESDCSSPRTPVVKKNIAPNKFSLGMEPLFEPLLQPSVGTQRLQHGDPNARLQRMQSANSGAEEIPGDHMMPRQQKKRLQEQMAGEAGSEDDDATVSDEEGDDAEIQRRASRSHFLNQSVASIDVQDTPRFLNVTPINIPKSFSFMRFYHMALYIRWPRIILVVVMGFIAINVVFGLLYWSLFEDIVSYPEVVVTPFEHAFFMSVHTLATIGYGSIAPKPDSLFMNFWVFVETCLGIIAVTIITGIAWAKFARPRAHIHFSSNIIISNIYGHRCLVFRAANTRHSGEVHENFFRIGVILTNRKTGLRQVYDVPLVTAEWPSIKLPATLIHIIDESSPFYKFESSDEISESRVAVIVLMTGLDTTFSENVYARKMYFWDDFAYNMQFADFALLERDCVHVDFEQFDELIPAMPMSASSLRSC